MESQRLTEVLKALNAEQQVLCNLEIKVSQMKQRVNCHDKQLIALEQEKVSSLLNYNYIKIKILNIYVHFGLCSNVMYILYIGTGNIRFKSNGSFRSRFNN